MRIRKAILICLIGIMIFSMSACFGGSDDENEYELDTNVPANSKVLAKPVYKIYGNMITWRPVENAEYYQITVGDQTHQTTELRFAVPELNGFTAKLQAKNSSSNYTDSEEVSITVGDLMDGEYVEIEGGQELIDSYTAIENRMHPKQNHEYLKFKNVVFFSDEIQHLYVSAETRYLYLEKSVINLKLILEGRTNQLTIVMDNSVICDWNNMDNTRPIISFANEASTTRLLIISTGESDEESYLHMYYPQNADGDYVTNGIFSESRAEMHTEQSLRRAEDNKDGESARPAVYANNLFICGDADLYIEGGRGQNAGTSTNAKKGGDGAEAIKSINVYINLFDSNLYLRGGRGGDGSTDSAIKGENSPLALSGTGVLLNGSLTTLS